MAKPEMRPPDLRKSNPHPAAPEQQGAASGTVPQAEE
jgi:hypothetical protein